MVLFVEKKGVSFFYAEVPENGSVAGKPISKDSYEALSGSGFITFKKVEEYDKNQNKVKRVNRNPQG